MQVGAMILGALLVSRLEGQVGTRLPTAVVSSEWARFTVPLSWFSTDTDSTVAAISWDRHNLSWRVGGFGLFITVMNGGSTGQNQTTHAITFREESLGSISVLASGPDSARAWIEAGTVHVELGPCRALYKLLAYRPDSLRIDVPCCAGSSTRWVHPEYGP